MSKIKKTKKNSECDDLIKSLCNDLKPVKCLRPSWGCAVLWAVLAALTIGAAVWYIGLRHDMQERLHDPAFLFEMILAAMTGIAALKCSFLLRMPDMGGKSWMIPIPFSFLSVFLLWEILGILTGKASMPSMEFHHCMNDGLLVALVPGAAIFLLVIRGCTTRPVLMAVMNGLAIAAIGYITLRLTCGSEDVGHIVYTHILPFLLLGTLAGLLARKLYKW